MTNNEWLKRELEMTEDDIRETTSTLENLNAYKSRILQNINSSIDINTTLATDLLDDDYDDLLPKFKLVSKFCHTTINNLTIFQIIVTTRDEYLRIPGFGKKSLKRLEDWLNSKGLVIL